MSFNVFAVVLLFILQYFIVAAVSLEDNAEFLQELLIEEGCVLL